MAISAPTQDTDGSAQSIDALGLRSDKDFGERQAFIYVISAGEASQKIGITRSDPKKRLASLQTGHPLRLSLLGYARIACGAAREVEKTAHATLQTSRSSGEWFSISPASAVQAVEQAAGVRCEILPSAESVRSAMTGAQIRAARALLGWSAQQLAAACGVGITTIRKNEVSDGPVTMIRANIDAITRAFETAGVELTPENGSGAGVRLKKAQDRVNE